MTVTVVRKSLLFTLFCHNLFGFFLTLASCLTSLALHIEFEIACTGWYERATSQCVNKLKGRNTGGHLVFVSNQCVAGKPLQTAPAHQLCILEDWCVFGDRYSPRKGACFGLCTQHRRNIDQRVTKTIAPRNFQKIHMLCNLSLTRAQDKMWNTNNRNDRRSSGAKFSVFALSFGVFYRLPGSR